MKNLLFLTLFLPFFSFSQNDTTKVFNIVEQMPEFPGGEKGLMTFIKEKFNMKPEMKNDSTIARVVVGFVVDEKGNTRNITIKQSANMLADCEAVRVIALLHFKPGRQKGKPIATNFTLPISILPKIIRE